MSHILTLQQPQTNVFDIGGWKISLYFKDSQTLYPLPYHYLSLRSHRFYVIQHLLYQFSHHTTPVR